MSPSGAAVGRQLLYRAEQLLLPSWPRNHPTRRPPIGLPTSQLLPLLTGYGRSASWLLAAGCSQAHWEAPSGKAAFQRSLSEPPLPSGVVSSTASHLPLSLIWASLPRRQLSAERGRPAE